MKTLNLLVALLLISVGWAQASSLSFEPHPYLFAQKADTLKTRVPVLATHLMGWKSPRRAMLYSLILPGMGQWYSDSKGAAKLYFAVEAGLWSYFLVSKAQEGMLRSGYIAFAAGNANTNPSGAPDQYFKDLGQFYSSDSANEWIRRQAREQFPNDKTAQNDYINSRLYTGDRTWYWKNQAAWFTYRDQRVRSLEAGHRASYVIGWAIVHHVLSALDAARVASRHNHGLSAAPERWDWKLGMTPTLEPGLSLSVGRGF